MNVLLVGGIEPSLAKAVEAKYKALLLPNDATRTAFLAKHGASITAVVDGGPPGVDADLMKALPNLGAIVHQESATTPSTSTRRADSASGSATPPT